MVVEAVYCAPGEFSRPSPGVARVRVAEHCAVTFSLDAAPGPGGPQLSVDLALLTRSHNELFAQVRHSSHSAPTNDLSVFTITEKALLTLSHLRHY